MSDGADGLPAPGDLVGGGAFRVERLVGQGGMGAVFAATQVALRRQVAVKLLRGVLAAGPEGSAAQRRLVDEATAAARLRHPSLVEVLAAGTDARFGPFVVYELLPGGSLRDELAQGRGLGWAEALRRVGAPLLEALAALHGVGVVHRDVKPENLFAGPGGSYKLGDLGLAQFEGRHAKTATGLLVGTPGYLAPEVVAGAAPGPAADLYAAAVTLVEAAAGRLPFGARDPLALLTEQASRDVRPVDLPRGVFPAAALSVLVAAMARAPAARPRDAGSMLAGLCTPPDDVAQTSAGCASPPAEQAPTVRVPAPHVAAVVRRRLGAAAAVLVAATLGLGLLAPGPTADPRPPAAGSRQLPPQLELARRLRRGTDWSPGERSRVAAAFAALWADAAAGEASPPVVVGRAARLTALRAAGALLLRRTQLPAALAALGAPAGPASERFGADGGRLAGSLGEQLVALAPDLEVLDGEAAAGVVAAAASLARARWRGAAGRQAFDAAWPRLRAGLGEGSPWWGLFEALGAEDGREVAAAVAAALPALRRHLLGGSTLRSGARLAVEPLLVASLREHVSVRRHPVAVALLVDEVARSLDFLRALVARGLGGPWAAAHRARLAFVALAAQGDLVRSATAAAQPDQLAEHWREALRESVGPVTALLASPALPPEVRASLAQDYAEVADELRLVSFAIPDVVPADGGAALRRVAAMALQRGKAIDALGRERDLVGAGDQRDLLGPAGRAYRRFELDGRRVALSRELFWLHLAGSLAAEGVLEQRRELADAAGQLADPDSAVQDPVRRGAPFLAPGLMVSELALVWQQLVAEAQSAAGAGGSDDLAWSRAALSVGGRALTSLRKGHPRAAELEPSLAATFACSASTPLALRAVACTWGAERDRTGLEPLALGVLRDLPAFRDGSERPPSGHRQWCVDEAAERAHGALDAAGCAARGRPAVEEMLRWLASPDARTPNVALRAHTLIRRAEFLRLDDAGWQLRDVALAASLRAILDDQAQDRFHQRVRRVLRPAGALPSAPPSPR